MFSYLFCVSEAGAVWLLINPGAAAQGTGEAQVAKANDAYATYYNPAGLGFMEGKSVVLQHVNWLPNLVSDIFYDFIGFTSSKNGTGDKAQFYNPYSITSNEDFLYVADQNNNSIRTFKAKKYFFDAAGSLYF